MKRILIFISATLLFGCNRESSQVEHSLPTFYAKPKEAKINLEKGYARNVITKERIPALLDAEKDTIPTGKALLLKADTLPSEQFEGKRLNTKVSTKIIPKDKVFKSGHPQVLVPPANLVNFPKPKPFFWVNESNDTLPTSKSVVLKGRKRLLGPPIRVAAALSENYLHAKYDIHSWNIKNGLQTNIIYAISKSARGGLWLATYRGLSYYDGHSFEHYTTKQGLPSNNIKGVLEDSQGNVWIGFSILGVAKLDGDSLTMFGNEVAEYFNFGFQEDQKGNVWWGSTTGLYRYSEGRFTKYTTNEGLLENRLMALTVDQAGNIWTGSRFSGISKFDGKNFTNYNQNQGLPSTSVKAIFADREGIVWISYAEVGVVKYDGKRFVLYSTDQGFPSKYVTSFHQDKQGYLWMGTRDGIIKFDGTNFTQYNAKAGLVGGTVWSIQSDEQNNIWAATIGNGLVKLHQHSFEFLHLQGNSTVVGLDMDAQGKLWVGLEDIGWLREDTDHYEFYEFSELRQWTLHTIKVDRRGAVWLGTTGGLFKYYKGQVTHYLPKVRVVAFLEDKQGNMWAGTMKNGLLKFTQKKILRYKQGLLGQISGSYNLLEDRKGQIWATGRFGISKISGKEVTFYSQKEGLVGKIFYNLLEDSQGHLWIGTTRDGLIGFDGKKFTYYTRREGLVSDAIMSILEGPSGDIWVATPKGLNCLKRNAEGISILPFDHTRLVHLLEFQRNSRLVTSQGKLYWGTDKHLVSLDAKLFQTNKKATRLKLIEVELQGQRYDYRQLNDSIQQVIRYDKISKFSNVPQGLSLPHHINFLTFYFMGTQGLASHDKIRFSYRIKELSRVWSRPSLIAQATYQNLPSGNFTLEVKALNAAQQWGPTLTYSFTIRAPYWQTWWFRMILVGLMLMALLGVHQWRLAAIKRKKKRLEQALTVKTIDLLKANQQLLVLNDELNKQQNDIIILKEKERKVLLKTMKSRERRFFTALQIFDEKYKALSSLDTRLGKLSKTIHHPQLIEIKGDLKDLLKSIANLDILSESVESKYPKILAEIMTLFPHLSQNEAKHCLLVKLDCSGKEAAQLLGVSVNAVRMARKRLKRKFNLNENASLRGFLQEAFV